MRYGRYLVPFGKVSDAVGLDLSQSQLNRCNANLKRNQLPVELVRGDIRFLPFRADIFDAILCLNFLYLLEKRFWCRVLEQFANSLHENGELDVNMRMRREVWTKHYAFGILLLMERLVYEMEKNARISRLWKKLGFRTTHGLLAFFTTEKQMLSTFDKAGLRCKKQIDRFQGHFTLFVCQKSSSAIQATTLGT